LHINPAQRLCRAAMRNRYNLAGTASARSHPRFPAISRENPADPPKSSDREYFESSRTSISSIHGRFPPGGGSPSAGGRRRLVQSIGDFSRGDEANDQIGASDGESEVVRCARRKFSSLRLRSAATNAALKNEVPGRQARETSRACSDA
jgi:hypothetical protein